MSKNRANCTTAGCIDNEGQARIIKDLMRYTLVLAAIAFAIGIAVGGAAASESWIPALLAGAALAAVASALLPTRLKRPALLVSVCLLGVLRGIPEPRFPAWLNLRVQGLTEVTGEVISYPAIGQETIRFTLRPDELPADLRITWAVEGHDLCGGVVLGDRVRVQGAARLPEPFEGFDYPAYLERQGIFATMYAEGEIGLARVEDSRNGLLHSGDVLRQRLIERFRRNLGPDEAALAQGLLLGDRSAMPDLLEDAFEATGLMHVLAVSGLHLGILLAGAWFGVRRLGLRPAAAYPIVGLLVLCILWIVGPRVSLVRASLMFAFLGLGSVLADVGWILRRTVDPANGLAAAAIAVLALTPGQIFESGFQLSFAATAGILLAFQPWMRGQWAGWIETSTDRAPKRWRWAVRALLTMGVVSLAAQAGAAPIVAWHYGSLHLSLVLANLLVIPWVTVTLWTGLIGILIGASAVALLPFGWLLASLAGAVGWLARLPGVTLEVSRWIGLWLGGLVGFAVLVAYVSSSSRTWYSTSMTSSSVEECGPEGV